MLLFSLLLFIVVPVFSQSHTNIHLQIKIPFSAKKSLTELPFELYRENIRKDSLIIEIPADSLNVWMNRFPALSVLKASPMLDQTDMAASLEEALTFTKYPTYYQYDSMMHYFADTYPDICMLDTFGYSREGRLLLALKISDNVQSEEDEPAFLYTATIHGDELIGYILTLRLADFILKEYGSNVEIDRIVNDVELWINPLSNPDYTFYGGDTTVAYSIRPDFYDLNRSFPDPPSGDKNDTSGIRLENQYMMLFMMEHDFNLSANLHAGAEVVNYPWDHTYALHPDDDWYIHISREYADLAHDVSPLYMDGFTDGITNGAEWYVIHGGRQDYVNYYLHGREVTLELSNIKKVASGQLETYWNYNQWSLLNMISQSRYGIHGNVKSANTGLPVESMIWVMNHDDSTSWVKSDPVSGNFYRYLKEGAYDLCITADGYIDDTIQNIQVTDFQKTALEVFLDSTFTAGNSLISGLDLSVFPNPASGILNIQNKKGFNSPTSLWFRDLSGKLIINESVEQGACLHKMDLAGMESGIYILEIKDEAGNFWNNLVVLE